MDKLRQSLSSYKWSIFDGESNVEKLYCDFITVSSTLIEKSIPLKHVAVGNNVPSFVTPLVKQLLRKRNSLMRKGRVTEADEIANKNGELNVACR